MEKTLGEIADELTILELKVERLPLDDSVTSRKSEVYDYFVKKINALDSDSIHEAWKVYKDLKLANREIWNLEESMRNIAIVKWFPDLYELYFEMGKRAESIRKINKWRVKYKELLNTLTSEFIDKKGGHLSE